ncbi:MAG: hypothetical protein ACKO7V_13465 [Bacteroidota bacterium]
MEVANPYLTDYTLFALLSSPPWWVNPRRRQRRFDHLLEWLIQILLGYQLVMNRFWVHSNEENLHYGLDQIRKGQGLSTK